jgi:hypothetical protein
VADKYGDARQARRQGIELALAGAIEIRPQQQVFRRIAAQCKFRGQQQIGASSVGTLGVVEDLRRVAGKVAERDVDLGNGNFQHGETICEKRGAGGAPGSGCE